MTLWRRFAMAVGLAVTLAFSAGNAASARAGLCVDLTPLVELGCRDDQGAGATAPPPSSHSPVASLAAEPVRRTSTEPRYDPRLLAVTFKRGTGRETIRDVISHAGTTMEQAIPAINAYLVGVEPDRRAQALESFRASSVVASASRELLAEAFDTSPDDGAWPQQEGLRVAGFPRAWDVTRGSSRIVVAIIDTGVDARHSDLRGALVPGYDFVNSDADPADDHGHGTAVAGIVAARSNNREGGAGICWRCLIMPIKVLDAGGNGSDTVIAAAIVWAADHGAKVINLSLGGPGSSQELSNAIAYAFGKHVIVVAAAGNSGTTTEFFPAADPRAVSVAATTVADRLYSWSSFGPWVRIAAPGCNVAPLLGGGFGSFCGTSSAAPLVTGLIALELSASPTATAQEVEQALVAAAVPLPQVVQYGRIDAGRTLALLRPAPTPASVEPATAVFRGTIGTGARTRTYRFAAAAGKLTATLRFARGTRLVLSLTTAKQAKAIAHVGGASPLRLTASLSAGTIALRVVGAAGAKTAFVLNVSYPARADQKEEMQ